MKLKVKDQTLDLDSRCLLMGILNVTPDSFSENGANYTFDAAKEAVDAMVNAGAAIIDVGGESTRPGAEVVSLKEELQRTIPLIEYIAAKHDVFISIDTTKSEIAAAALATGAAIINDISGLNLDPAMRNVAAEWEATVISMHMRGTPQTMQQFTDYDNLITDINKYFAENLQELEKSGIKRERIALDPGIGFSKTAEQNLEIIKCLDAFSVHQCPILIGPSRKSFIGKVLDKENPQERLWGTAAAISAGIQNGARIIRVHDVAEMKDTMELTMAILNAGAKYAQV